MRTPRRNTTRPPTPRGSFDPHTFLGSAGLSANASNQGIPPTGAPSGAGCV